MPYRKNAKNHDSTTNMPKSLSSGLPAGTRVSISLEPSGPPDPFGDHLLGGILAGHATLVLETSPAEEPAATSTTGTVLYRRFPLMVWTLGTFPADFFM